MCVAVNVEVFFSFLFSGLLFFFFSPETYISPTAGTEKFHASDSVPHEWLL